jgi:dienelactone hydrolase
VRGSGVGGGEDVVARTGLRATRFGADAPLGGVVLVPARRGAVPVEQARALVAEGFSVVVPDLWWRLPVPVAAIEPRASDTKRADVDLVRGGEGARQPSAPPAAPLPDAEPPDAEPPEAEPPDADLADLSDAEAIADIAAARDLLPAGLPRFVIGFGAGGLYARLAACALLGLSGAVDFYGRVYYPGVSARRPIQPLDLLPGLSCPLQVHAAGRDPATTLPHLQELERRLAGTSRPWQVFRYPGRDPGFVERDQPGWDPDAAATAWARAVSFLLHLAADAN